MKQAEGIIDGIPFGGKDLSGRRFGKLVVVAFLGKRGSGKRMSAYWRCVCDCGVISEPSHLSLTHDRARSCGKCQPSGLVHGFCTSKNPHPMHKAWDSMIQRCHNPTCHAFPDYGGRGILVCDAWRAAFMNFYADMSALWRAGLTIDRIDNDKGYTCGHCEHCRENGHSLNCRWTTMLHQARNRRNNRWVEFRGEKMVVSDLASRFGIARGVLRHRILSGWDIEDAVGVPVGTAPFYRTLQIEGRPR